MKKKKKTNDCLRVLPLIIIICIIVGIGITGRIPFLETESKKRGEYTELETNNNKREQKNENENTEKIEEKEKTAAENKENVNKDEAQQKITNQDFDKYEIKRKNSIKDNEKIEKENKKKWNKTEIDNSEKAIQILKEELKEKYPSNRYSYNIMEKVNEKIYVINIIQSETTENIGYYRVNIESKKIEEGI